MGKTRKVLIHMGLAAAFVALGVLGLGALTASKPKLGRQEATVPLPVVRVSPVQTGPQTVHISGEGTVNPLREIQLVPQVDGKVVYMSPQMVNGGEFRKGDVLVRIDPVDYTLALALAEAKVRDSESNLKIAAEEAAVAVEEWRIHNGRGRKSSEPPPLVAKEPQLAAAQAMLEAQKAELKKARLNLERTELKAPFDGMVSAKNVDIGQYVARGTVLATLFSIEAAEIMVPLEDRDLRWFHVPGFTSGSGPGSPATVRATVAGRKRTWTGRVVRAEGKVDARTRLIHVVVRVDMPYAQRPPLAPGLFVWVDIEGVSLDAAARIPRAALHPGEVVWVVDEDGTLRFREVQVARLYGDDAVLESGLEQGEMVAVSSLKAVTDGMTVRPVREEETNPL